MNTEETPEGGTIHSVVYHGWYGPYLVRVVEWVLFWSNNWPRAMVAPPLDLVVAGTVGDAEWRSRIFKGSEWIPPNNGGPTVSPASPNGSVGTACRTAPEQGQLRSQVTSVRPNGSSRGGMANVIGRAVPSGRPPEILYGGEDGMPLASPPCALHHLTHLNRREYPLDARGGEDRDVHLSPKAEAMAKVYEREFRASLGWRPAAEGSTNLRNARTAAIKAQAERTRLLLAPHTPPDAAAFGPSAYRVRPRNASERARDRDMRSRSLMVLDEETQQPRLLPLSRNAGARSLMTAAASEHSRVSAHAGMPLVEHAVIGIGRRASSLTIGLVRCDVIRCVLVSCLLVFKKL